MFSFLILYTGSSGSSCVDIQRAANAVDALVQHKAAFPHSKHAAARKIRES